MAWLNYCNVLKMETKKLIKNGLGKMTKLYLLTGKTHEDLL